MCTIKIKIKLVEDQATPQKNGAYSEKPDE